jgi:hypothetical protein
MQHSVDLIRARCIGRYSKTHIFLLRIILKIFPLSQQPEEKFGSAVSEKSSIASTKFYLASLRRSLSWQYPV